MGDPRTRKLALLGDTTIRKVDKVIVSQYKSIKIELFDPTEDEIINGLLSRNYRFFSSFLISPSFWAGDIGEIISRSMLETNIYLLWLLKKNDKSLYLDFKKYGIGQEKKYKAKLIDYVNDGTLEIKEQDTRFAEYLNEDTDKEIWDELVDIELKNFENIRGLADEVNLKYEYDTLYEPASSVVHGHYNSLAKYYLKLCRNPLHRFHYVPNFGFPPLALKSIMVGADQFFVTYEAWRKHYKLDDKISNIYTDYLEKMGEFFNRPAS